MKLKKTNKNKITFLSRQQNDISLDMKLIKEELLNGTGFKPIAMNIVFDESAKAISNAFEGEFRGKEYPHKLVIYDPNAIEHDDRYDFYFNIDEQGGTSGPKCLFTQTPDPNKAILITGKLQTSTGGIPSGVNQILTQNDNFLNVTYMRNNVFF